MDVDRSEVKMPLPDLTRLICVLSVRGGCLLLHLNIDVDRMEMKMPLPDITRLI